MLRAIIIFTLTFGLLSPLKSSEHPARILAAQLDYQLPNKSLIDVSLVSKALEELNKVDYLSDSQKEIVSLTLYSLITENDLGLLDTQKAYQGETPIAQLIDVAKQQGNAKLQKLIFLSSSYLNVVFKEKPQNEVNLLFAKSFLAARTKLKPLYHDRELGYHLSLYIKAAYTNQLKHRGLLQLSAIAKKLLPDNEDLNFTEKVLAYNLPIVFDGKNLNSKKLFEVIQKQLLLLEKDDSRTALLLELQSNLNGKSSSHYTFKKPFYKKYTSLNVAAVSPKKEGLILPLYLERSPKLGLSTCKIVGTHGSTVKEYLEKAFTAIVHLDEKIQYGSTYTFQFENLQKRISGNSASLAMALSILSLEGFIHIPNATSATGAVSETGEVLEVGGLVKKIHAAITAQQKYLIIPKVNERDLRDFVLKYGTDDLKKLELLSITHLRELPKILFELEKKSVSFQSCLDSSKDLEVFLKNNPSHESASLILADFDTKDWKYSVSYSIEELKGISDHALTDKATSDEDISKAIQAIKGIEPRVALETLEYCKSLEVFLIEYLAFRNERENNFKRAREKLINEGGKIDLLLKQSKN
ncbi:MAG: hypothetical protein NE334_04120 [Lentisphaeraceae bacterium]|nr:hypothetical protein [Lentisphaeraceae bacterium]